MPERVWDQFLTENDRASLRHLPPRSETFGEHPALILVDVYRGAFGDRPEPLLESIRQWPASCGQAGWDALPHISTALAAARAARVPVVHITGMDTSESGIDRWSTRGHSRGAPTINEERAAQRRRGYEIMPDVEPIPGEAVIRKVSPSAFSGTPLLAHLNSVGVDTLIVVGESTSGCVRATVVDARACGFAVFVAEECVFDRHEAAHAINLFDIHQKYGAVLSLPEILAFLPLPTEAGFHVVHP